MQTTGTNTKVAPAMDAAEKLRISSYTNESILAKLEVIKTECIVCSNFQKDKIRNCAVITCPLHTVRPYQVSNEEADD